LNNYFFLDTLYFSIILAVDGGFGEWSEYAECSASCGQGFQDRERTCNSPLPQNGGKDCASESTETRSCQLRECPGRLTVLSLFCFYFYFSCFDRVCNLLPSEKAKLGKIYPNLNLLFAKIFC